MQSWGARVVRGPIHPAVFRWYEDQSPGSYMRLLEWGVAWAAERGIFTIFDFHGTGYPPTGGYDLLFEDPNWGQIYALTPQQLRDCWDRLAQHFSGDPRIAMFDLFNEPRTGQWGADTSLEAWLPWRNFAEQLIDIIRAHDPDRVVLVGGLQYSYDPSPALENPVRRPNVVYASHPYPWSGRSGGHRDWQAAFGDLAQVTPVLVAETGFDPDSPNEFLRGTAQEYGIPLIDEFLQAPWYWLVGLVFQSGVGTSVACQLELHSLGLGALLSAATAGQWISAFHRPSANLRTGDQHA